MNKTAVSLIAALLLTGCSLKEVSQPIVKYTIEDDNRYIQNISQVDKVLKVSKLKAPKYTQSTNIWYQRASYETNSYLYSSWNESFSDLVEQNIADTLFKSGLFKSVFTRYSKIRADLVLESEMVDTMQKVDKNKALVYFATRLYLIDAKTSELIGSKDFSYIQKCDTVDAKGAVKAYNELVQNFNKDMVKWLKILVKEN